MTNVTVTNVENAQQQANAVLAAMRKLSRKATLASVGLAGMAYDTAKGLVTDSTNFVDKAEQRGEQVQKDLTNRVHAFEKQTRREVKKLRRQVESRYHKLERQATAEMKKWRATAEKGADEAAQEAEGVAKELEAQVQQQVEQVLNRLGIPSRDRLDKLSREIQELNARLDAQLAAPTNGATATSVQEEMPLPGYNTLTGKEVLQHLPALDLAQLQLLRSYEATHANRITVLRAVDEQIKERLAVE
jgi:BMFP domain-containing protein YqiC